jgi:electron transport complex protein RnfE
VQVLGCPTLAVTNSVANSLAMGVATFFVLAGSSVLVSLVRKVVPNQVRISTFILIIATFTSIADMALEATVPAVHKALSAFIGLIVVTCIILGRAEAFARSVRSGGPARHDRDGGRVHGRAPAHGHVPGNPGAVPCWASRCSAAATAVVV